MSLLLMQTDKNRQQRHRLLDVRCLMVFQNCCVYVLDDSLDYSQYAGPKLYGTASSMPGHISPYPLDTGYRLRCSE